MPLLPALFPTLVVVVVLDAGNIKKHGRNESLPADTLPVFLYPKEKQKILYEGRRLYEMMTARST